MSMKRFIFASALTSLCAPLAIAAPTFQLGGGLASQVVSSSYDYYGDGMHNEGDLTISNGGLQITGRVLLNHRFGFDASYARMGNGDAELEISSGGLPAADRNKLDGYTSSNISTNFLVGLALDQPGWYGYSGIGLYRDRWTQSGVENQTFNGLQIPVGGGYNFSWGTLDAQLAIKESSDYDSFMRDEFDGQDNPDTLAVAFRIGFLASF